MDVLHLRITTAPIGSPPHFVELLHRLCGLPPTHSMPKKKTDVSTPTLKTSSGMMPALAHRSFDLSRRTYQADVIFSHLLRSCTMEEMLVKVVLDRDGIYFSSPTWLKSGDLPTRYVLVSSRTTSDHAFRGTFLRSYYIICEPRRLLQLFLDL